MLLGGCTYAYMVGVVCGIVSGMDHLKQEYNATMDDLNMFMTRDASS